MNIDIDKHRLSSAGVLWESKLGEQNYSLEIPFN